MKILSKELVFDTAWFKVVAKKVPNVEEPFYSLALPDYVSVLPITENGDIVLVRQFRPAVEKVTLELPSGLCEVGEAPEDTASRELLEETGYASEKISLLGPAQTADTGRLGNQQWCFIATECKQVAEPENSAEEDLELAVYSPTMLTEAIKSGEFDHALNFGALLLAQMQGLIELS